VSRGGGLSQVLDVLRWRWKTALVLALAVLGGAVVYVHFLPSKYDGKAIVAVGPRPKVVSASADTVRVVGPKYVAYITAPATVRTVAARIGASPSTLENAVNATLAQNTGTITVTVRLRSPSLAAKAANAFALQAVQFSEQDPLLAAQLVAPALTPTAPSSPPRALLDAAALLVGLLLGIGVSVLLERGRPRLRSWREMAELTGYPVLGRVPLSRAIRHSPLTAFADPAVGSALRTLRANLEPELRDRQIKLIIVTSASPGDGKTVVAALLAESLSRLGATTLLVDADLHRPGVARLLSRNENRGLSGVLALGSSTLRRTIEDGWVENLSVLPTAVDHEAADLLAREFSEVAELAGGSYDYIVVDTPPLGMADASAIASSSSSRGLILVVYAGSTTATVNESILAIEALKTPLLGIVGNRLKEPRDMYDYYQAPLRARSHGPRDA
jgi:succinoglycan biosynthesis transport protein ExoP